MSSVAIEFCKSSAIPFNRTSHLTVILNAVKNLKKRDLYGAFVLLKENQRFSVRSVNDGIAKNERHPMGSSQSVRKCPKILKEIAKKKINGGISQAD